MDFSIQSGKNDSTWGVELKGKIGLMFLVDG